MSLADEPAGAGPNRSPITSRKYAEFTRNSESMKRGPRGSVSMKGLCQFVPRSSLIDPCKILAAQLPCAREFRKTYSIISGSGA